MVKVREMRTMFSNCITYTEVYGMMESLSNRPYETANYVWTVILSQSVDSIPRIENSKQIFERSVEEWQKKQRVRVIAAE